MIAVNELRIGNWVRKSEALPAFQVIGEDIHDLERLNILALHPIALSTEILKKAGFKQQNFGYVNEIYIEEDKGEFFYTVSKFNCDDKLQLKHLHQLQNLYFALTGEELEVNL